MSDTSTNPRGFVEEAEAAAPPPAIKRPPVPEEPLQRLLWLLTWTVEEKPQMEGESIAQKAVAMSAVQQAIYTGEIVRELRAIRDAIELKAARDFNEAAAGALDKLWNEIILANHPNYGEWQYPGQAYRHIRDEFDALGSRLRAIARPTSGPDKPITTDKVQRVPPINFSGGPHVFEAREGQPLCKWCFGGPLHPIHGEETGR